ncbi:MAG: acid shock protein [Alcanivoracaceae bacterium]
MMNKKLLAMAVAAGMGLSGAAWAANDGDVGTTSTGDVDVTLVIPQLIQIIVDDDIDLGTYDPDSTDPNDGSAAACVRTNGSATYYITATSANPSGTTFRMTDGSSNFIEYSFTWATVALSSGQLNDNGGAGFARDNGGPGFGACTPVAGLMAAEVSVAQMESAEAGDYEDTVTLTVSLP